MKKQKYIWVVAMAVAAFILTLASSSRIASAQPTSYAAPASTNTTGSASTGADVESRYHAGEISKGLAIQAKLDAENKKPLDIYGKVVDQFGEPVAGARIEGSILRNVDFVKSGTEKHFTETDSDGRFSFVGINGVGIGIHPSKEGYIYNGKLPSQRPKDYAPDPSKPLVFTMWKIQGPENLVNVSFASTVAYDGTPTTFDIATRKKDPNGDLQITLLRSPADVKRSGQKFDWTVEVEILHGGILPENDAYPYLAAERGYQSVFTFSMSSNNVPWRSSVKENFYIRSSHGQYGRMEMTVYSATTPPRIKFDFTVNPSGSRNLEPNLPIQ